MASAALETLDPVSVALDRIADGDGIRPACAAAGIARSTLWDALQAPELAGRYARARDLQAEHHMDELHSILRRLEAMALDPECTTAQVMALRTSADKRQWIMSKFSHYYADRTELSVSGNLTTTTVREVGPHLASVLKSLGASHARALTPNTITLEQAPDVQLLPAAADPPTGGE